MSTELAMDELFQTFTQDSLVEEANRQETVRTGGYTFQAIKVEARMDDREEFETGPNTNYGRKSAHLFGNLSKDGQRAGKISFDVSWEEKRTEKGNQDRQTKLWGQLVKALNMKGASVGEVLKAAEQYPLYLFVTESFKGADGGWINPKTDDERVDTLKSGAKPYNFVQNVGAVR